MKIAVKFLISLVLALLLAWVIRTYVFTVFSVPVGGLPPQLKEGNRVIVNRMDCDKFNRGDVVVFADSVQCKPVKASDSKFTDEAFFIGKVEKLPGDTIQLDTTRYVIPTICCKRCGCKDCRYYIVRTSQGTQLVHKHQIVGKAYKLF